MKEEKMEKENCCSCQGKCHKSQHVGGGSGALYGLGVVGALFYFLQNVVGVGAVLMGIGKAFFWPAFVVFKVLTMLKI